MRSEPPPLLPILRSRTQGEVLGALLSDPSREWTITELAGYLSLPLTTAQSEIARLEAGGLLQSRKVGRSRLVKPDESNPVVPPLTRIIMFTFGPKSVIQEEFAGVGAKHVLIFGSWAARITGEAGPPPSDIDVLVVGDHVARDDLYAAAERAEARLRRPVNPVLRSTKAWADPATDPLLNEILRRPVVHITAPDDHSAAS